MGSRQFLCLNQVKAMLTKSITGVIWAVCFIAVVGVFADRAEAFDRFGGRHYRPWYSPYQSDFTRLHAIGNIPTPPYFSLHPPVYYSRPVARTYGYSPYAYPPQTRTPESVARIPRVIQNRFVPSPPKDATKKAIKGKVTAAPVRIVNPFMADGEALAKSSGGQVKIVYPVLASQGR